MKVVVNGETREIKVASIGTLLDVVSQIEVSLPQGHIITEIVLNGKVLDSGWYHNATKIYLLDEDTLNIRVEESTLIAREVLKNSKGQLEQMLNDFSLIADAFRVNDEKEANKKFVQGIENLQWFNKILEDSTILLGRPLNKIIDKDVAFSQYINQIGEKLDQILKVQAYKDWIMLADLIEYEMIPALKKLSVLYEILDI